MEKKYEATVLCVAFSEDGTDFEDILYMGVAHSPQECGDLIMQDLWRLIEDYEPHEISVKEGRSIYDEPITIVKCGKDVYHYYILFKEDNKNE